MGAGTGNDVAAALRRGFNPVVAIDIDPAILQTGAGCTRSGPTRIRTCNV